MVIPLCLRICVGRLIAMPPDATERTITSSSAYHTGLRCKCPACGKKTLYKGFLEVHDHCSHCSYSFANHDAADGPAYIAIIMIGSLITTAALFTEILLSPPIWVHLIIWLPLTVLASLYCLRIAKSLLISLQHMYRLDNQENSDH